MIFTKLSSSNFEEKVCLKCSNRFQMTNTLPAAYCKCQRPFPNNLPLSIMRIPSRPITMTGTYICLFYLMFMVKHSTDTDILRTRSILLKLLDTNIDSRSSTLIDNKESYKLISCGQCLMDVIDT